jgi:AcrR family transcriptional regulator
VSPDKPPTARQAAAEQTRQKLLAAAVAEFSQRPYGEVTVGGIAKAAGVAHGLVSHHFQGKQGAYAAAVDAVYQQIRAAEDGPVAVAVGDQVRQRFRAFLTFVAEHPDTALNLVLAAGRDVAFVTQREHGLRMLAGLLGLDRDHPAVAAALGSFAEGPTVRCRRDGRGVLCAAGRSGSRRARTGPDARRDRSARAALISRLGRTGFRRTLFIDCQSMTTGQQETR